MITLCLDKSDFLLAKDVIQFVREKVDNQDNCVSDVLIASVWLTVHSAERSQKRCGLKDLIVIDQQIQTLTSDEVDDRENTEPNTIKTRKKLAGENEASQVDNIKQQIDKTVSYKNIGRNIDKNSGEKVDGISCTEVKIKECKEHRQYIQDHVQNNSKIRPDVQQVVVTKEANKNNSELEIDDNVIKIENDIVTINFDDDFSKKNNKNTETPGKHKSSVVKSNGNYKEQGKCLHNDIKIEIDDIGSHDNDPTDKGKKLQQIPVSSNEVSAVKPTDQAQPVMILSNIFNSEVQSSQWSVGDLMVSSSQNNQILLENVAEDSPFDSNSTNSFLSGSALKKNISSLEKHGGNLIKELNLKQKVELISQSNGKNQDQLAEIFGVGNIQVQEILKHKTEIMKDYQEIVGGVIPVSMEKRKRKELSLKQKVELINQSNGKTIRQLAEIFGVGKTQVQTILKRKVEYMEGYQENSGGDRKRLFVKSPNEEVNNITWEWFRTARSNGIQVSGPMLQKKALIYAKELGVSDFKASNGWLSCFLQRHKVSLKTTVGGESANVSQESVSDRLPQNDGRVRTFKEEKDLNKE